MPNPYLDYPGDYNLNKIEIITATGEVLPLRMGMIVELNVFEDIESSALTGSMVMIDSSNIISNAPLQGNERLVFKLSTPVSEYDERVAIDASEETGYPFHIYAIKKRVIQSETLSSYNIQFCSRELLRNTRTRVSRAYEGEVHQAAIKILRDKNGLDSKKRLRYEPTKNKEKLVIPNMRPFRALDIVSKKALSKNSEASGYYFYETTKGFNFRSYESMLTTQGKYGRLPKLTLGYQPKALPVQDRKNYNMHNVDSYEFLQHFDTLSQQSMGTYSSRVITYSIYDKNYNISDFSYHDQFFKHFHADQMSDSSSRNYHIGDSPVDFDSRLGGNVPGRIGDKTVSDYHESKVILYPSRRFLHDDEPDVFTKKEGINEAIKLSQANQVSNSTILKVVMPGHSYVEAGDIVEFKLPSLERNKGEYSNNTFDEKYSGRYLVAKLRHRLIKQEYRMVLELVKDSVAKPYIKGNINYKGKPPVERGTIDIYQEDQRFNYFAV
tara:strand:+ start:1177 stop:2661 length:1485 start_codon:yes stop_codon:yes gene_type:complete